MIESMTPEQEAQVSVYHDKFLKQGLSTERLNVDKAVEAIKSLYRVLNLKLSDTPHIQVFDSPEAMCLFAAEQTGEPADSFINKICWGNISNYWVSFYSFINNVLEVKKEEERIKVAEAIAEHCGPFLMFENAILLSQRPTEIHLKDDNKTKHREYGPVIDHADGLSRGWYLNDVKVTEKAVMTKPEDFTKEDILNEKNADIRAQILLRIPTTTLIKILEPKEMDEKFGYTLLGIDIGDDRGHRPFLKMTNPSEGIIHIEGVARHCETVEEAICFRNSLKHFKLPRTLDGKEEFKDYPELLGDYHQQGDCLAFPIDLIPSDAVLTNTTVVGEGMRRHHAHGAKIYIDTDKFNTRYIESDRTFDVIHEATHGTMRLAAGKYKIVKVLEFDHWLEESREVVD